MLTNNSQKLAILTDARIKADPFIGKPDIINEARENIAQKSISHPAISQLINSLKLINILLKNVSSKIMEE